MYETLKNKTVIVTGGAGVLCGGFAAALAKLGARVAVADISAQRADETAQMLQNAGGEAMGVEMNVLDTDSVRQAYERLRSGTAPWPLSSGASPENCCPMDAIGCPA